MGTIHHSHAAAAYLTFDSVVAKKSADERIWSGSDGGHGKPSSPFSAGIVGLNLGEVNEEPRRTTRNHEEAIAATDFLTAPTVTFRLLYKFEGAHRGFQSLMIRDVAQHQVLVLWSNTGVANLSYLARQIAIVLVGGNYNPIHQSLREVLGPVVANEAAVAKYRALEQNQPAAYDFSEDELNEFAYFVMMEGRITDAIELFKLNVERHPNSFNVYDSLGEV